jgi:hypothetical protein
MRGKATVAIVAWHKLLATDGHSPRTASSTRSTGNDGRNNHGLSKPLLIVFPRGGNPPGDFMPQNQGKWMPRGHPFEGKTYIRVTNTAARNLHHNFLRAWFERRKGARLQGALRSRQLETVRTVNASHGEPPTAQLFLPLAARNTTRAE